MSAESDAIPQRPHLPWWGNPNGRPAAVLTLTLALFVCWQALEDARNHICHDLYQAWVAASALRENSRADVYTEPGREKLGEHFLYRARDYVEANGVDPRTSRRLALAADTDVIHSTGTPWMYAVLGMLFTDDYDADTWTWQYWSLASLVAAVVVFCRLLGYSLSGIGLAIAASVWALPIRLDLWLGNVNRLQLGMMAGCLLLARWPRLPARHLLTGCALGMTVMFKPNIAPLVMLMPFGWAVTGQRLRAVHGAGGAALGIGIAIAVPCWVFDGPHTWIGWWNQLADLGHLASDSPGNVAAMSPISALGGNLLALGLAASLVALGGLLLLSWISRRSGRQLDRPARQRLDVALVGAGSVLGVLTAPLVWMHYFALAMPLALYAARPRPVGQGDHLRIVAWVSAAFVAQLPPGVLPGPGHPATPSMVTAATYALLALPLVEWLLSSRARRERQPA